MSLLALPTQLPLQAEPSRCPVTRTMNWLRSFFAAAPVMEKSEKPHAVSKAAKGGCPFAHHFPEKKKASVFVEKASEEARTAPQIEGDKAAAQLLAQVRSCIYHWPQNFAGFTADVEFREKDQVFLGKLIARSSRDYELNLPEFETLPWLRFQIEELISHREAPEISRMASRTGLAFGDVCPIYGQKLIFLGDKMESYYRVKDNRITQISRAYAGQRFVILIDQHEEIGGRFAAKSYQAYYEGIKDQAFTKVESYLDSYQHLDGVSLPLERRFTEVSNGGMVNRVIRFHGVQQIK